MPYILALILLTLASCGVPFVPFVHAAGDAPTPPNQKWSYEGIRGEWDQAQILRGYEVATQVCLACHSFKYTSHRHLMRPGFSEEEVKVLAQELGVDPKEPLLSPLTPEDAKAVYAKEVPDLSLMTKARQGGADYIYALLTGYEQPDAEEMHHLFPEGLPEGASYNKYFPGHAIAMPNPLTGDGLIEYRDGTEATVDQMAKDVAYFIAWSSQPELQQRKHVGVFVLIYLIIFTVLTYLWKNQIWAKIKKKK
tara:strand:- start:643 stop:1395 length:753 start_codon:yes stop_codon:yes gene_type:complete